MRVPFVDLAAFHRPKLRELAEAIGRVITDGHFIGGQEVEAFEEELADYLHVRRVVAVSSGSDALLASLMALGVGPGDEVITSPFTFAATAMAISRLGATPVFADIELETFNLDPLAVYAKLSPRTKAIIPVHLFGRPAAIPLGTAPVVEDACQAIGASPLAGVCGALSFFPTKPLGCMGDGGAVYTDDVGLAQSLRAISRQGQADRRYRHHRIGGNFRLDALQAAILRVKLPYLDQWTAARRDIAASYRRMFEAVPVTPPPGLPAHSADHVYSQFVIRVKERDALRAWLSNAEIQTEVYYPVPLHQQPCWRHLGYGAGSYPIAEQAAREALALPCSPTLSLNDQARVVAEVLKFLSATPIPI